jgi:hypothetical protein
MNPIAIFFMVWWLGIIALTSPFAILWLIAYFPNATLIGIAILALGPALVSAYVEWEWIHIHEAKTL